MAELAPGFSGNMGLFGNMARYAGAVVAWSAFMPMVIAYNAESRIER